MIPTDDENVTNHSGRSQRVIDKAIDRVRKMLALSKGTNEHEAALAASKAAQLVEQFQLTEAMIRIDEPAAKPEPIEKSARLEPELAPYRHGGTNDHGVHMNARKRVAWKEAIASAVASDLGVKMYWCNDVDIRGFGRESAIQTWRYTYHYLCRAVEELADGAWLGKDATGSSARAWKNAFRVGCAGRISMRLWEARQERKLATRLSPDEPVMHDEVDRTADPVAPDRECQALAIVQRDQAEVDSEYKEYSKEWRGSISGIGATSSRDGYSAGKAAGDRVRLGGGGRRLPAGQGRLRKGRS